MLIKKKNLASKKQMMRPQNLTLSVAFFLTVLSSVNIELAEILQKKLFLCYRRLQSWDHLFQERTRYELIGGGLLEPALGIRLNSFMIPFLLCSWCFDGFLLHSPSCCCALASWRVQSPVTVICMFSTLKWSPSSQR